MNMWQSRYCAQDGVIIDGYGEIMLIVAPVGAKRRQAREAAQLLADCLNEASKLNGTFDE